jgi:vesicle coat complex subunit
MSAIIINSIAIGNILCMKQQQQPDRHLTAFVKTTLKIDGNESEIKEVIRYIQTVMDEMLMTHYTPEYDTIIFYSVGAVASKAVLQSLLDKFPDTDFTYKLDIKDP